MLPDWTVVGFSGHRNITDEKTAAAGICAALDTLAAKSGPLLAVASVATGSDTLFVEEVARRKIPFFLVLPFPAARFSQDFEPGEWERVAPLLKLASHVEEITGLESDEESYMETGVRIVDQADVVVVVWNGKPSAGLGGTGDVVSYSRDLSKPLHWLNPDTGETLVERFDQLPVHTPAPWNGDSHETVEKHFQALDETASTRAPGVRQLVQWIVLLHLIDSAIGLSARALKLEGIIGNLSVLLEFGVLGTAFLLAFMQHRKHLEWTKNRIEAEICRSFLATWPMRRRITRSPKLAIQGFDRLLRNLRLFQLMDRTPAPPLETARDEYLASRIQNQIVYFASRGEQAKRSYRRLSRIGITCTGTATLLAAVHFVLHLYHVRGPVLALTDFLSILLPIVGAALFSLILTQEHSRRASRYGEMASMLQEAAGQLKAVRTWNGLTRIATDTEEQLLNEAAEWHSFRRFTSH